jgi:hypothetical protein
MFIHVRFQVLTSVTLKTTLLWDMKPYTRVKACRYFGRTYFLYFQDRRMNLANKEALLATWLVASFGSLFDLEYCGNTFVRNVGELLPDYTKPHGRM